MKTLQPSIVPRACAFAALAVLLAGCVGTSAPAENTLILIAGRTPQAVLSDREIGRIDRRTPAGHHQAIVRAEAFGRAVYERDRLADEAGDLVAPGGHPSFSEAPAGWLTEHTPAGLAVEFLVKQRNSFAVAAEVVRRHGKLHVRPFTPPRNLSPQEMILWQARELAYTAKFKACSKRYNPVVIPARVEGIDLIYVYLLPASSDPDTIYLGGYQRIAVGPDGKQILEEHAFTHGCVTLHRNANTAGMRVTELASDSPTSAQVYASLRYGLPVYVETVSNGLNWKVQDGRVTLVRK